jgi:peptidoglycan/LPS O-acetylase OafA/YrhL
MAEILFVQNTSLPAFFVRRFSRIYPALLTFVIMMLLVGLASITNAAATLSFTINYTSAFHLLDEGSLSHIWSVCVEEHCYVLLAGIAVLAARKHRATMAICISIALLAMLNGARLYVSGATGIHELYWRTDVRLAPVFLSAGLFLLLRAKQVHASLPLVAAGLSAPLFYFAPNPLLQYTVPTILLAFAVNTIDQAPGWVRKGLSLKPLTQVGAWSYSLYIWQQPFYLAYRGDPRVLPAAIACALLSFYLIESPARRAINDRIRIAGQRDRRCSSLPPVGGRLEADAG